MEIRIEPSSGENVLKLKQDIIKLCDNNEFGVWHYKDFSFGEEALYKELIIDGTQTILAFLIDIENDSLILNPAKVRGEGVISLQELSYGICDVIAIIINKCPLILSSIIIIL